MRLTRYLFLALLLLPVACTTIDLHEKTVAFPGHAWKKENRPSFTFRLSDTSTVYELQLVLRHTDRYHYNNIWLNLGVKTPGTDSLRHFRVQRVLATDEQGWLGTGMDDIYEHRISLNDVLFQNDISLRRPGDYTFTLEQIMREDPLQQVMNAGIRLEKKP